ncbi:MAG: hypothetical protein Q7T87_00945 [Polaromonas sp.]|nr:hypothetical protein [Polaromonas sp.]
MFIAPGSASWKDSGKPAAEAYSKSQDVRDWLVHTALAGNNIPLTPDLHASHAAAFRRAREGVRKGLIELDYAPADEQVVDVPPINHPHHMQAMLYWCVRLDCTLELMSEAYAQLGRGMAFDQVAVTVRRLEAEESKNQRGWLRTRGRTISPAATMPMFGR